MNFRKLRPILATLVLVATVAGFINYFATHETVRHQLSQTSWSTLVSLLMLYIGTIAALAMIMNATLRLCKVRLGNSESLLVTAYTAIVNFFGPLQSGPAFRAIYLKKKYNLNLKNYAVATLVYYFFWGSISGIFLLSGLLKWWLVVLGATGLLITYGLSRTAWLGPRLRQLDLRGWYYLAAATFLQIALVTLIYYTELRTVAPGVHLSQAIVYAGAANLALFVSFTPGAIGFRESFLLFSQHLHHLSNDAIVAANILDRAMYVSLLLLLAIFIFGSHASRRLQAVKTTTP
jgi:uncharacterized membrane protein YbhN (UPF0104 family)